MAITEAVMEMRSEECDKGWRWTFRRKSGDRSAVCRSVGVHDTFKEADVDAVVFTMEVRSEAKEGADYGYGFRLVDRGEDVEWAVYKTDGDTKKSRDVCRSAARYADRRKAFGDAMKFVNTLSHSVVEFGGETPIAIG